MVLARVRRLVYILRLLWIRLSKGTQALIIMSPELNPQYLLEHQDHRALSSPCAVHKLVHLKPNKLHGYLSRSGRTTSYHHVIPSLLWYDGVYINICALRSFLRHFLHNKFYRHKIIPPCQTNKCIKLYPKLPVSIPSLMIKKNTLKFTLVKTVDGNMVIGLTLWYSPENYFILWNLLIPCSYILFGSIPIES